MIVGYARVSTTIQDTTLQLEALRRAGVDEVYQEKVSAVATQRPELERMLQALQPGDIVKVYKIDRLARSMFNLLSILQRIEAAGAAFQSVTESVETSSAAGRMMLQMLGAFAEFERSLIRERTIAGQVAAVQRGVSFGRPKLLSAEQEDEVYARWKGGETKAGLSRVFGVSLIVVRRIVDERQGVQRREPLPVLRKYLG